MVKTKSHAYGMKSRGMVCYIAGLWKASWIPSCSCLRLLLVRNMQIIFSFEKFLNTILVKYLSILSSMGLVIFGNTQSYLHCLSSQALMSRYRMMSGFSYIKLYRFLKYCKCLISGQYLLYHVSILFKNILSTISELLASLTLQEIKYDFIRP